MKLRFAPLTALMTRLAPGSFGWLLTHELRISLRGAMAKSRAKWAIYLLAAIAIGGGILLGIGLRDVAIPHVPLADTILLTAAIGGFTFMVTQGLIGSQRALYETGDLDLLFSAPLSDRVVLQAKLVGIAGTIFLSFAMLTLPLLLPVAVLGHPQLLGFIALLVALAMLAACVGLALTLVIARAAGPRTARTAGQITAAVLGGGIFLVSQFYAHAEEGRKSGIAVLFERIDQSGVAHSGLGKLPGDVVFGDPVAILILLALALVVFTGTGLIFQRLFQRGFQDAGARLSSKRGPARSNLAAKFQPSLFAATFRKEILLLLRDPALAFQIVLRLIYLLPLLFVAVSGNRHLPLAPGLAFFSVAVAGQLAGSFAWLTVSAEDAPDLIRVAPVAKAEIDWIKLLAALTMTAPFAILLPIAIAIETPLGAVVTLAMTAAAGMLAGFIELKLGKPAPRKTFARRRSGSLAVGILTLMITAVLGGISGVVVYFLL